MRLMEFHIVGRTSHFGDNNSRTLAAGDSVKCTGTIVDVPIGEELPAPCVGGMHM